MDSSGFSDSEQIKVCYLSKQKKRKKRKKFLQSKHYRLKDYSFFERWLGHEGGAPMNGISVFMKEAPESTLAPPAMWGHSENTSVSQEGGSHQTLNLPALWSWTAQPPELWEINVCYSGHQPMGLLLWEPGRTKTVTHHWSVLRDRIRFLSWSDHSGCWVEGKSRTTGAPVKENGVLDLQNSYEDCTGVY